MVKEFSKGSAQRTSGGVVDAMLINMPDLSMHLKLKNLIHYFMDTMNSQMLQPYDPAQTGNLSKALDHLCGIERLRPAALGDDILKMVGDFIADARELTSLMDECALPTRSIQADISPSVRLTAKASRLEWLSVCILEEMKSPVVHSRSA